MRMALSSRCRLYALMWSAWSQSPLWGAAAANNLAMWYGSLYWLRRWLNSASMTVLSHFLWLLMSESTGGCMPLLTRADKHFSNMSSLIELNTVQNPVLESTWCPQRKPERQKMPATTHVLYHYAPGGWFAATDHRSMTHYICCKLLSSVDRQISFKNSWSAQHADRSVVYAVTLERLLNFWVEPAHHGMK